MRVVVVGAGVMGASLAWRLAEGGAEVTLVEAIAPGAGTSSRGAGLVTEAMWHPTNLRLVQRSIEILAGLDQPPFRFHATGSVTLLPHRLVEAGHGLARAQRRAGADVREVAPDEAPVAGMDVGDVALALHYPRDGWAFPRFFAEVATMRAQALGARVVRAAASLALRDGRAVVRADGEELPADAVALACGVHTRALLREAGLDAPLLAYRTQAARVLHPRAGDVPILHDAVQGFYLRPGPAGELLAGDGTTTTPEDATRWRAEADDAFVRASLARVRRRFPHLADARPGEAWAGIDAATPDRLLLAGPHPAQRDVWLLAGGNGLGFMRAPAAGESLAALMLGKRARVDVSAFDPARFGADARDFEIREGYAIEEHAFM